MAFSRLEWLALPLEKAGAPYFTLSGFVQVVKVSRVDRLSVGRGATRAEDAPGTPTQSHISPSILEYED